MKLDGRVAVVTGSTRGIGRTIAHRFAREGARVVVTGRNADDGRRTVQLIEDDGGTAAFFAMDVSDEAQVQAAMAHAVESFGPISVLVNNAGPTDLVVTGADQPVHQASSEGMAAIIGVGLFGPLWCCKHAIPSMIDAGGGSIVNISSMAALTGLGSTPAYTCAKGGLSALTRQLAVDYGAHGIRSNSITLGLVIHEFSQSLVASPAGKAVFRDLQLTRLGEPGDVATAAVYLASDDSAFMTGANITLDGGTTIKAPQPTVEMFASAAADLQTKQLS